MRSTRGRSAPTVGQRRRPALASRRSPGMLTLGDGLLDRARGRPDRALARRRRRCTSARSRVGARRPGRRAQHAVPGRVVGARRGGRAGLGRLRRPCPAGEYWSGAPAAARAASPAARGPTSRPDNRPALGGRRTPRSPWSSRCCRSLATARRRSRSALPGCGQPARSRTRARRALLLAAAWRRVVGLRRAGPAGRGRWSGCSRSGSTAGHHPVHGRQAWQAWSTLRVLDEARTWLFPLYSSSLTPAWLRALGARGRAARSRRRPCC